MHIWSENLTSPKSEAKMEIEELLDGLQFQSLSIVLRGLHEAGKEFAEISYFEIDLNNTLVL
jgi:hypothetical protein